MLSPEAVQAVRDATEGYCTLAVDIETGQRSSRDVHVAGLLCELTGAEAATTVNNNAAAVLVMLNSLAKGKEVIISRGQLLEVGGFFRMLEVRSTNKTHLRDYASAINESTGAIMCVHTSNYRIAGFTEEASICELVALASEHNLPVFHDLGSGAPRMEPVWMALGRAADTAAHLAKEFFIEPRYVPVSRLQAWLAANGQVLTVFSDIQGPKAEVSLAAWQAMLGRHSWLPFVKLRARLSLPGKGETGHPRMRQCLSSDAQSASMFSRGVLSS